MKKALNGICSAILLIVIFISFLTSSLAGVFRLTEKSFPDFADRIYDDEYRQITEEETDRALRHVLALVAFTQEELNTVLEKEKIFELAKETLNVTFENAFGASKEFPHFEDEELHSYIESFLLSYAEEHEIEYAEGSSDQVYQLICNTIDNNVTVVSPGIIDKISPYLEKADAFSSFWYVPLILLLICLLLYFLLHRKRILSAATGSSVTLYFASLIPFASFTILLYKDYFAENSVLAPLPDLVLRRVTSLAFERLSSLYAIPCFLFLILSILFYFFTVKHAKKENINIKSSITEMISE